MNFVRASLSTAVSWYWARSYRLRPNIGNTLRRVSTMFTCLAITPLAVNRFGWNLGYFENIACRWPWQILGAICAEVTAKERDEFLFFLSGKQRPTLPYRFPVGQISWNLHTRRGSVSRRILSEENFENFPVRGRFFQTRKFWPKFPTTCDFRPL